MEPGAIPGLAQWSVPVLPWDQLSLSDMVGIPSGGLTPTVRQGTPRREPSACCECQLETCYLSDKKHGLAIWKD